MGFAEHFGQYESQLSQNLAKSLHPFFENSNDVLFQHKKITQSVIAGFSSEHRHGT